MSQIRRVPVDISEFSKYYAKRSKHSIIDRIEYSKARSTATKHTFTIALAPENIRKNLHNFSVPYDFNRVKLSENFRDTDYINASYIGDVGDLQNRWIVCQGPMERMTEDFWSMIWKENSNVIVMLTRTFELTRIMCVQYWPPHINTKESYGDFTVTLLEEENFAAYIVRSLNVKYNIEERVIRHYHYVDWPAYESTNTSTILQFRRHVRHDLPAHSLEFGPPILHCHEGGSRCGMFLGIDLQELLSYRKSLFQSPAHYRFVYDVLEDHLVCGITTITMKKFISLDNFDFIKEEYERIQSLQPRFSIGDCAAAHMKENQSKNRNVMVVPPDNHRLYLSSFQGSGAEVADYINAVYLDGFKLKNEFIATEWPMTNTLVFNNPLLSKKYPRFWPEGGFESYGVAFAVEVLDAKTGPDYDLFTLSIHKTETAPHRKSQHMHVAVECSRKISIGITRAPKKIVKLVNVHKEEFPSSLCLNGSKQSGSSEPASIHASTYSYLLRATLNEQGPMLVVSTDGYSRSGIYIAGRICAEQLSYWDEVDIFQSVTSIRRRRPQFIRNIDEYKKVYEIINHFVSNYSPQVLMSLKAWNIILSGDPKEFRFLWNRINLCAVTLSLSSLVGWLLWLLLTVLDYLWVDLVGLLYGCGYGFQRHMRLVIVHNEEDLAVFRASCLTYEERQVLVRKYLAVHPTRFGSCSLLSGQGSIEEGWVDFYPRKHIERTNC
ncbi:unnamed protein product [Lepeophtheirus salmonis]|uniref:(salmon louse) hypothetical protein n=1 Tax=Lepeophtheirus salmonis TaxID=72036 RepID=A0A7R8CEG1_LEPSM|nr:unnamed protein product [Lepeophtheirus salmonis]CAF2757069.1 unnamed protein product [Lepeophtheirus salmonis]